MELGGFEEGWEGEDAAKQVVIEEERGDTTKPEELPSSEEKEEAEQEWHPSRSSRNTELAAQYELAQEQQRLEEEMEAAARGRRRSCRQRGAGPEEVGCSEGVSVECQA